MSQRQLCGQLTYQVGTSIVTPRGEKKVQESTAYEGPPPTKDKILWCLCSSLHHVTMLCSCGSPDTVHVLDIWSLTSSNIWEAGETIFSVTTVFQQFFHEFSYGFSGFSMEKTMDNCCSYLCSCRFLLFGYFCIFLTVSALMLLLPLLLEYASGQQKFLKKGGQTKQGNPSLCLLLVPSIPKNIMMFIQDIQVPHQNGQCLGVRFFGHPWTSLQGPMEWLELAWSSGELRTAGSQWCGEIAGTLGQRNLDGHWSGSSWVWGQWLGHVP